MSSSPLNTSQQQLFEQQPQQANSFVDRQLQRAMTQVRIIDMVGGFLMWGSLTLGFLLMLAIIDAWIFPLSVTARVVALILIVGVSLLYLFRSIWPLVTRRINPMFAAKMLEEGQQDLNNSLVNFLSFRDAPSLARRRIFEAMANRAAVDLSSVSIESTIDRAKLIRFGYLLVALVAVCAGYMIFSPKNPLATVARIVAPLADVPPPARVEIVTIEPGNLEVTFGQSVEVTAEVKGLRSNEEVELIFTTADRQHVDRAIPMTWDQNRGVHTALLTTGPSGIEHSLVYQVLAGDARSRQFTVTLRQSPTASIEQISIVPPNYTSLPIREQSQGDVSGVEGTVIEIEGVSNFPLQTAVLELLRNGDGFSDRSDPSRKPAKRIRMTVQGDRFIGRFPLELAENRTSALYSDYRIALLTDNKETNENPSHYQIDVFPDMAPEIEWIQPTENTVELPVNGKLRIETRAVDRDFAIQRVELHADQRGKKMVGEELLDSSRSKDDQHLGKYTFVPGEHGLQPGDTVVLHAVAEDNRCDPLSGLASPNRTRTSNLTVRITGKDSKTGNGNNDGGQGGSSSAASESDVGGSGTEPNQSGETRDNETGSETTEPNDNTESSETEGDGNSENQERPETGSESQENESQEDEQNMGSGGSGAESSTQNSQENNTGNQSSSGTGGSENEGTEGSKNGNGGQSGAEENSAGGQTSNEGENSTSDPGGQSDPQEQLGSEGSTKESSTTDGSSASGPNNPEEVPQADTADSNSDPESGSDSGDSPHEGDVFEKILEKLQSEQDEQNESSTDPDNQGNTDTGNENRGTGTDQDAQSSSDQANRGSSENKTGSQEQEGSDEGGSKPTPNPDQEATNTGEPSSDSQNVSDSQNEGATGKQDRASEPESSPKTNPNDSGTGESETGNSDSGDTETERTSDPGSEANPTGDDQGSDDAPGETNQEGESTSSAAGNPKEQASSNPPNAENGKPANEENETGSSSEPPANNQEQSAEAGQAGQSSSEPSRQSQTRPDRENEKGTPGQSSQEGNHSGSSEGDLPEGEEANLEYSRRATDLVLDYLQEQADEPDADLLSDLDWTEDDLRDFLSRWQAMRDAAGSGSADAKSRLDNRIRSLGLMPGKTSSERVKVRQDSLNGIQQDGVKSSPPPEFAEKFRLFLKGAAREDSSSSERE
ncbi:MAG: hypothetical protein ACON32_04915 [Pirellulaceae bacterium]